MHCCGPAFSDIRLSQQQFEPGAGFLRGIDLYSLWKANPAGATAVSVNGRRNTNPRLVLRKEVPRLEVRVG